MTVQHRAGDKGPGSGSELSAGAEPLSILRPWLWSPGPQKGETEPQKTGLWQGLLGGPAEWVPLSHLSFHASPPLLLLFPFPHVLVLLFRFCHGLKKLIENPKELIWLDFASLFPKVLHRFSELEKKIWKKEKKISVFQENWFPPSNWILQDGWSAALTGGFSQPIYLQLLSAPTHHFPSGKLNIPDFWSHVPRPVISAQPMTSSYDSVLTKQQ